MPSCGRDYEPEDPLDGADKCLDCRERSKEIGFKVDIEMAERRRNAPVELTPLQLLDRSPEGNINMRDLGISPID